MIPVTIALIISGSASTIAVIIVGSASTIPLIRAITPSISKGNAVTIAVTIELMISGRASSKTCNQLNNAINQNRQ